MNPKNLDLPAILFAAHENHLTPEQSAQLNAALEADPAAVAAYVQHVTLNATLHHNFHASAGNVPATVAALERALNTLSEQPPARSFRPYAQAAALILLASLTLLILAHFFHRPAPGTIPASLTFAVNAEWDSPAPVRSQTLSATPLTLRRGIAQFTTSTGALVTLQAPATIRFTSASSCTLLAGTLSAHIPPAAVGFTVRTENAAITDLGTDFGVYLSDGHHTHTEVFTGKVRVSTRATSQLLEAHHALDISDSVITPAGLEPVAFVRLNPSDAPTTDPAYTQWLAFSNQLRQLPEALAYFPFDNESVAPQRLLDRSSTSTGHDGTIEKASWVTGRFPGKSALLFNGIDSRVHLALPGKLSAFTLAAWINPDEVSQPATPSKHDSLFASILSSDGSQPPTIEWMFFRGVHPILRVAPTNPASVGSRRYDVPNPIPAPELYHHWSLLAVTYDPQAKRVIHYLNGEPLATLPITEDEDPSASFGESQIGSYNAVNGTHSPPTRQFKGVIDELIILARPLSAQEIQTMYLAGNPDQ